MSCVVLKSSLKQAGGGANAHTAGQRFRFTGPLVVPSLAAGRACPAAPTHRMEAAVLHPDQTATQLNSLSKVSFKGRRVGAGASRRQSVNITTLLLLLLQRCLVTCKALPSRIAS